MGGRGENDGGELWTESLKPGIETQISPLQALSLVACWSHFLSNDIVDQFYELLRRLAAQFQSAGTVVVQVRVNNTSWFTEVRASSFPTN